MDELVNDIMARTGLDRPVAEQAIGIIVSFLEREGPSQKVTAMIDKLPGARALADAHGGRGGIFAAMNDLGAAGLGMGEIRATVEAFIGFAKAKLGDSDVDAVIRGIPGAALFI